MSNKKTFPALKIQMGSWEYYSDSDQRNSSCVSSGNNRATGRHSDHFVFLVF